VVHGNTDEAFAVIARMRRRHRAALPPHAAVWHCRDFRPLWGFGRRFASQADSIIAVSDAVRAHLARQRVPRANVIHNGVALNELLQGDEWLKARRDVRRELHLPDDALVIGSAGSFVAWKQHDLFIRLVHALPERVKGCPVVGLLCGDDLWGAGTLKRSLERAAGSRVRLTGWREDMPRVYPAMDVFVSAADEPFGRVFVEAQASGLPVVAADRGGAAEIIVDRQTGCLVRPELDSFLDATRGLLAEPAQRRAFGEAGRRRMLAHFDISRCADAFAKHVKQLAGRYGCRGDAEDD
jgi:glycosyltransferase involved in cell wall biosynthesis